MYMQQGCKVDVTKTDLPNYIKAFD